jgi:hypothetical protein
VAQGIGPRHFEAPPVFLCPGRLDIWLEAELPRRSAAVESFGSLSTTNDVLAAARHEYLLMQKYEVPPTSAGAEHSDFFILPF